MFQNLQEEEIIYQSTTKKLEEFREEQGNLKDQNLGSWGMFQQLLAKTSNFFLLPNTGGQYLVKNKFFFSLYQVFFS